MGYKCLTVNNASTQKAFLKLPFTLYGDNCPQNKKTEKQILTGTHVLSENFKVYPFVVLDETNTPVSRCLMTLYDGDPVAYLGFFESQDDIQAVKKMMFYVERKAKKMGKKSILGPIDASIYINYRFKTSHFCRTYTGEPYNKDYYKTLWRECGFEICDRYVSNQMRQVEDEDFDERLDRIYKRYLDKGYEFVSPDEDDFEDCLEDVYDLLMETYASFKGYKSITKEQFMQMYAPLEDIINYDMVKLAYHNNKLRAFCISIPNYGTLLRGPMNPIKFYKMVKFRSDPKEYVILYAGADKNAPGLGGALMHVIRNELHDNKCTSIGALIHEGNMPTEVYKMLHTDQYKYVLLSKQIHRETTNEAQNNG